MSGSLWCHRSLAGAGLVLVLACQAEQVVETTPPDHVPPGLDAIALRVDVDLEHGQVRVVRPATASTNNESPDFAIVGTNEITATTSNLARTLQPGNKARVTFDVALTNRLTTSSLVPPTFPTVAAGLLLFPFKYTSVVGGTPSQVLPSVDFSGDGSAGSGAPRNFFNDAGCPVTGITSDCLRWEQFTAPLYPGETTPAQSVGFDVPRAITSFSVYLAVAADVQSDLPAPQRLSVTPPNYVMNNGFSAGFSAVAYDINNNPLPWVTIHWTSPDVTAVVFQYGSALVGNITGPSVVVHGRKVGQTFITARTGGLSVTVPIDIQVNTIVLVQPYILPDSDLVVGEQVPAAASVKDNSGLIVPGFNPTWSSSDASVATVDPVTGLITATGPGSVIITATAAAASGTIPVTVSGGSGGWTTKAALSTPREKLAGGVINGLLYAVGGNDAGLFTTTTVEAYNPATNSWSTRAPMSAPRHSMAAGVINGVLYVAGGTDQSSVLGTVEAYDPITNAWSPRAPMLTPRVFAAGAALNGLFYVVGGSDIDGNTVGTVEVYDPATDSWSTRADLPTPRLSVSAGVIGGMLYAAGGIDTTDAVVGTLEAYDPATDSWSSRSTMGTPRYFTGTGVTGGRLYVAGGVDASFTALFGTVEAYDPVTDAWTPQPPLSLGRFGLAAGVINGVLYTVGGHGPTGPTGLVEALQP